MSSTDRLMPSAPVPLPMNMEKRTTTSSPRTVRLVSKAEPTWLESAGVICSQPLAESQEALPSKFQVSISRSSST